MATEQQRRRRKLALIAGLVFCTLAYSAWAFNRLWGSSEALPVTPAPPENPYASNVPRAQESNLPADAIAQLSGDFSFLPGEEENQAMLEFTVANGSEWSVTSLLIEVKLSSGASKSLLFTPVTDGSTAIPGATTHFRAEADFSETDVVDWKIVAAAGISSGPAELAGSAGLATPREQPSPTDDPLSPRAMGKVKQFVQASESGALTIVTEAGREMFFTVIPTDLSLPEGAPEAGDRVVVDYRVTNDGLFQAIVIAPPASPDQPLAAEDSQTMGPAYSDPLEMIFTYYRLMGNGEFEKALAQHGTDSREHTGLDELRGKGGVQLKDVSVLKSTPGLTLLQVRLASEEKVYEGVLRLVQEAGGWRFDRIRFDGQEPQVAYQAPPPPSSSPTPRPSPSPRPVTPAPSRPLAPEPPLFVPSAVPAYVAPAPARPRIATSPPPRQAPVSKPVTQPESRPQEPANPVPTPAPPAASPAQPAPSQAAPRVKSIYRVTQDAPAAPEPPAPAEVGPAPAPTPERVKPAQPAPPPEAPPPPVKRMRPEQDNAKPIDNDSFL